MKKCHPIFPGDIVYSMHYDRNEKKYVLKALEVSGVHRWGFSVYEPNASAAIAYDLNTELRDPWCFAFEDEAKEYAEKANAKRNTQ